MSEKTGKTFDKLAQVLKDVHPSELSKLLDKNERVNLRVSESDKDTLKATSKGLGLTVTEYLLRLHYFTVDALKHKGKR